MIKNVKKIKIECVLFDRGFGWGVIYKLKELRLTISSSGKRAEPGISGILII